MTFDLLIIEKNQPRLKAKMSLTRKHYEKIIDLVDRVFLNLQKLCPIIYVRSF